MSTPVLRIAALPPDERGEAQVIADALIGLDNFAKNFWAALSLFTYASSEYRKADLLPEDGREWVMSLYFSWLFVAGRDGAMTVFHLVKSIEVIQDRLHCCPTLAAEIDLLALRKVRKTFQRSFKDWEGVRHTVGHSADLKNTAARRAVHSVKTGIPGIIELRDGASLILNGCFVGDEFMSTFEGRQVSYALTAESHRVICKMVDDVYAIFQSVCDD